MSLNALNFVKKKDISIQQQQQPTFIYMSKVESKVESKIESQVESQVEEGEEEEDGEIIEPNRVSLPSTPLGRDSKGYFEHELWGTDGQALKRQHTKSNNEKFYGCSLVSNYELNQEIGGGTFGTVSVAIQKSTGTKMVLKKMIVHNEEAGVGFYL